MSIKPIRTLQDFQKATQRAVLITDEIWSQFATVTQEDKGKSDELEVLTILMEVYKRENWDFYYTDPIQAISLHMHNWGLKFMDLANVIGSVELAEEILNKKQSLTLKEVWKLCTKWQIPAMLLIQPYPLKS